MSNSAANTDRINAILAGLRRRQRLTNLVRWAAYGLLAGTLAGCIAAVVLWATRGTLAGALAGSAAAVALGVTVLAAIVGYLLPVSDLRLARAMDRAAASEDRFA